LTPDGSFAIVLPYDQQDRIEILCGTYAMQPKRRMKVRPKPELPPKRVLTEFIRGNPVACLDGSLTILNPDGKYSSEYLTLTGRFHNF
jgi:tRNA1(Val) A37 N6-methylase TrmN6